MSNKIGSFDINQFLEEKKLVPAIEVFVIANSILTIGVVILQFVDPALLYILSQFGADVTLISIGFIWFVLISDIRGILILVLSWSVAGIYAKKKYGDESSSIIFRGSQIPVLILIFSFGIVLISLIFSPGSAILIIPLILFIAIFSLFSLLLSTSGLLISQFVGFTESYDVDSTIEDNYLILPVIPEGEKVEHCPFRSNLPGCSYLGYKAPSKPLICDYKSSFLRCRVYAHIYESIMEEDL